MQIAEEQGPFLTWTARLLGARRAIEVGTFTGLSAMCIAEGLGDGGRLTCFDVNPGFVDVGRPHWERAGVAERIDVVIGPAADHAGHVTVDPLTPVVLDRSCPGLGREPRGPQALPMHRPSRSHASGRRDPGVVWSTH